MLSELTQAQREAVTHFEGPLLILAGPGSGKTRVVTHRVAWLLGQGVAGHQILALTFTNKAADEMSRRIERLAHAPSVWVGTFHRFCARQLRKYAPLVGLQENYTIYDSSDSVQALRRAIGRLKIDVERFPPESIAKAISWAKNNLIMPDQFRPQPGRPLDTVVQQAYPAYQEQLIASNAVDFDDLLLHVATMLRDNQEVRERLDDQYRFILLDEYQDTNLAQYAIARMLSSIHPNLAATGDPDQSIYGWRGANLNNILEFENDFPAVHVVRLEQNYRSTQRILRVAAELIAHNVRRKEKGLFTDNGPGVPVRLTTYATHKDEAEGIAARIVTEIHAGRRRPRDFAIFYRVNALSRAFEFALRDLGVPYQMVNGLEFFQRKEIKDVLAYLHLLNNPSDEVALLRVINTPARGIGKTTLGRLSDHAVRHGISMLDAVRQAGRIGSIKPRSVAPLAKFAAMFDRLAAAIHGPVEEILGLVLSETGYQKQLAESDDEDDLQRLANIEELLTVARDFDERRDSPGQLESFLEETCLVNDTDAWETDSDRVTLMTLHASKGLEFPVVFFTAVEEGLLPHERSREHPEQLEEERRLMFVGITRAQQELRLSMARYRDFRGQRRLTIPSSFLMELPRGEMDIESAGNQFRSAAEFSQDGFEPDHDWREPSHRFDDAHDVADVHEEASCQSDLNVAAHAPDACEFDAPSDDDGHVFHDDAHGQVAPPKHLTEPKRAAWPLSLTTASALANGGQTPPTTDPELFRQGMLVLHAKYGLGQISALSGSDSDRNATIDFPPPFGRKRVPLSEGALQPVGT